MSRAARVAGIAALTFIWGSTWLAIKIGVEDVPPFLGAAARFAIAAAILFALSRIQRVRFPRSRRVHAGLVGLGLSAFWLSYGVVYWAEQFLSSGLTAVLFATHPLFTLLLAHVALPAERMRRRKVVGMALGFAGVVLIFQDDIQLSDPRAPLAAALLLVSPLAAAASNVAIKRWGTHLHPYNLTILPMTYGTVALFATAFVAGEPAAVRWTGTAIGSIVYLATFGTAIAFVVYYTLLRHVAVTSLNLISFLFPVVAVVLGWLVLGETLGSFALVGGTAILLGIAVATWRQRPPPTAVPGAAEAAIVR